MDNEKQPNLKGDEKLDLDVKEQQINTKTETEPRKQAVQILAQEISEGITEIERSTLGLFLAGISAGLDLGFSALLVGVVLSLNTSGLEPIIREFFAAGAYSIGFLFVVIGRSTLFTEQTTLAILPVLNGNSSIWKLLRLWILVYASNLLGGAIFALLITGIGPNMGTVSHSAIHEMASLYVSHPGWVIFLGGILAGWLMGLLSWLVAASQGTTSQILIILFITGTIGLAHLQHSIAGSIEVLTAVFTQQGITLGDFGHFLLWATLGNIIGGVFFVGVIKYAQAIRSNPSQPEVKIDTKN